MGSIWEGTGGAQSSEALKAFRELRTAVLDWQEGFERIRKLTSQGAGTMRPRELREV